MVPLLFVVVHVLAAFWLIAGIIGRDACHARAGRADELSALRALTAMGSVFETTLVRPATFVVLVTGLAAAWARGWPILGLLQGGSVNWVLVSLLLYLSIVPVIVLVLLPKGRAFRQALEEASARGEVTPALRAALADPVVGAARAYEVVMAAVLVGLMILKPF